jgi:hypothetical protein
MAALHVRVLNLRKRIRTSKLLVNSRLGRVSGLLPDDENLHLRRNRRLVDNWLELVTGLRKRNRPPSAISHRTQWDVECAEAFDHERVLHLQKPSHELVHIQTFKRRYYASSALLHKDGTELV